MKTYGGQEMSVQKQQSTVVSLRPDSQDELTCLNRLTGLKFEETPESLLGRQEEWEAFTETLLGRAITFWDVGGR